MGMALWCACAGTPPRTASILLQQLEILMNRSTSVLLSLAALACAVPVGAAHADGDIGRGKAAFAQCAACHSVTGANGVGPHLDGVFGREAGKVAGFRYSPNMQKSTIKWDDKTLDEFLAAPSRMVPGTMMPINVPNAQMRQDLVAYLKSLNAGK
jgi:cytochrome c